MTESSPVRFTVQSLAKYLQETNKVESKKNVPPPNSPPAAGSLGPDIVNDNVFLIGYSGGGGDGSNGGGDGGSNGSKGEDGTGFDYGVGGAGSGVQIENIPITTFALRYAFSKPILTTFLLQGFRQLV